MTVSIFCRSVGPGGTSVTFYATKEGVKCVWDNEDCPYQDPDLTIDSETNEASDGHNVSMLPWKELELLLKRRPK